MTFKVKTEVKIPGIGWAKHEHTQTFQDGSNVFERVADFRQYIKGRFPGCEYKLIEAKEIKEGGKTK